MTTRPVTDTTPTGAQALPSHDEGCAVCGDIDPCTVLVLCDRKGQPVQSLYQFVHSLRCTLCCN